MSACGDDNGEVNVYLIAVFYSLFAQGSKGNCVRMREMSLLT